MWNQQQTNRQDKQDKTKQNNTRTHLAEQLEGADNVPLVVRARLEHIEHGHPGFDVRLGHLVSGSEGGSHVEVDAVVDRERGERLSGADFLERIREEKTQKNGRGGERGEHKKVVIAAALCFGSSAPMSVFYCAAQRKKQRASVVHILGCSSYLQRQMRHPRGTADK